MPLTAYQAGLTRLLSVNRSEDSYLAGGAALHIEAGSERYSEDLDYFHDSVKRVETAWSQDYALLTKEGYQIEVDMKLPGYIRAMVMKGDNAARIEWAHDSSWRFLPVMKHPECGYLLHPVDIAVDKLLALVGRDEPRDVLDTMHAHRRILPLGTLCWATAGKDPGYTPGMLLELLRRRGRLRPEDLKRLHLAEPVDLHDMKTAWLEALNQAEAFIRSRPAEQVGCLYYSRSRRTFVQPEPSDSDVFPHYGRPGGALPRIAD